MMIKKSIATYLGTLSTFGSTTAISWTTTRYQVGSPQDQGFPLMQGPDGTTLNNYYYLVGIEMGSPNLADLRNLRRCTDSLICR